MLSSMRQRRNTVIGTVRLVKPWKMLSFCGFKLHPGAAVGISLAVASSRAVAWLLCLNKHPEIG